MRKERERAFRRYRTSPHENSRSERGEILSFTVGKSSRDSSVLVLLGKHSAQASESGRLPKFSSLQEKYSKNSGAGMLFCGFHHSATNILPLRVRQMHPRSIDLHSAHTVEGRSNCQARCSTYEPMVCADTTNSLPTCAPPESRKQSINGQSDSIFTVYVCLGNISLCATSA